MEKLWKSQGTKSTVEKLRNKNYNQKAKEQKLQSKSYGTKSTVVKLRNKKLQWGEEKEKCSGKAKKQAKEQNLQ